MLILKPPVTNKKLVAKLRNPTIPVTQHKEPQNVSNNDKLCEAAIDPLSQVRTHARPLRKIYAYRRYAYNRG
jgi:hypothetical protein